MGGGSRGGGCLVVEMLGWWTLSQCWGDCCDKFEWAAAGHSEGKRELCILKVRERRYCCVAVAHVR